MKFLFAKALVATAVIALASCSNTADEIGGSLVTDETEVVIESSFEVKGHTTESNVPVMSRTIDQLLGDIDAKGYGKFSSEFVAQFMPATTLVTEGVNADYIDSVKLHLMIPKSGGCIGDSILPMGLEVYRLNKQLPSPIYSDFDLTQYYDARTGQLGSKVYTFNTIEQTDSVKKLNYRSVYVDLPVSLGRELYNLYVNNPAAYQSPVEFAKYFPGIAVRNSFGSGRVIDIANTSMQLYYHTVATDSLGKPYNVPAVGTYFAVTPEVVSNNCIRYEMDPALKARIDAGENILVAPAGRDVEIEFPLRDVMNYYYANRGTLSVVNALTFSIPAEVISNDYGISVPTNVLMVLKSEKESFFANNKVPDNKTSFYATYDSTNKCYKFTGLRTYLLDMLDAYGEKGEIPAEKYTFMIIPVDVETEVINSYYDQSTLVTSMTPYMSAPSMALLNLKESKVTLTFTKQTVK